MLTERQTCDLAEAIEAAITVDGRNLLSPVVGIRCTRDGLLFLRIDDEACGREAFWLELTLPTYAVLALAELVVGHGHGTGVPADQFAPTDVEQPQPDPFDWA